MNHQKHKQTENLKKHTQHKSFVIDEENHLIITSSTNSSSSFNMKKVQDNLPDYKIL